MIRQSSGVNNGRSAAPVFHLERHEASDRDGKIKLSDNRLQIGKAAGERVDRHDVAVAGRGQGRQAEIEHRREFVGATRRRSEGGEGGGAQCPADLSRLGGRSRV